MTVRPALVRRRPRVLARRTTATARGTARVDVGRPGYPNCMLEMTRHDARLLPDVLVGHAHRKLRSLVYATCVRRASRLSLARFPPVPRLGAVARTLSRARRRLLGRGAMNKRRDMSPAPALHHFIEALGLLRQLGEIDEVVPLLRHDQTSRSPSKCPARRTSKQRAPCFWGRNPCIFLGRSYGSDSFMCGMTRESSDGSACRDCFLWSKATKIKHRSLSLAAVGCARHLHKTRCSRRRRRYV